MMTSMSYFFPLARAYSDSPSSFDRPRERKNEYSLVTYLFYSDMLPVAGLLVSFYLILTTISKGENCYFYLIINKI